MGRGEVVGEGEGEEGGEGETTQDLVQEISERGVVHLLDIEIQIIVVGEMMTTIGQEGREEEVVVEGEEEEEVEVVTEITQLSKKHHNNLHSFIHPIPSSSIF